MNCPPPLHLPLTESLTGPQPLKNERSWQTSLLCVLSWWPVSLISASDIAGLTAAATGMEVDAQTLLQEARKTMQVEKTLSGSRNNEGNRSGLLPPRFFKEQSYGTYGAYGASPLSESDFEKEVSRYYDGKEGSLSRKTEKEQ